jgi:hypothetical protein
MRRCGVATACGALILLALTACGGSGATSTQKAQTATAGAARDAATVTAFAQSRVTGTPGTPGTSAGTRSAGTPTTSAGKGPIFTFATFPAGGGSSGPTARAGASPSSRATAAGVRGSTYTDPQGRFTFAIPAGWLVQQQSSDVDVAVAPQNLHGAFTLQSDTMPADASLDDYASAVLQDIQTTLTNFTLIQNSAQQATIGGQPAVRFEFTGGGQSGNTLHGVVYVVNKGTRVYGLYVVATPEDFDAVNNQVRALLDSFTFM